MKLIAIISLLLAAETLAKVPEVITYIKSQNRDIYKIIRGKMISTQNMKKEFFKNRNLRSLKASSTKTKALQKANTKPRPLQQPIVKPITQKIITQVKKQPKGNSIDLLNNSGNGQLNQIMGEKNLFFGDLNKIIGTDNFVVGNNNKIVGQVNAAKGDSNIVIGSSNIVSGFDNIVKGSNNYVSSGINNVLKGFDNKIFGQSSRAIGNIKNTFSSHKIFGRNKKSKQPKFLSSEPFEPFDLGFKEFNQVFNHPFFANTPYSNNQWSISK